MIRPLGIDAVRRHARQMEVDASAVLCGERRAGRSDAAIRKMLGDLAEAEMEHQHTAGAIEEKRLPGDEAACGG